MWRQQNPDIQQCNIYNVQHPIKITKRAKKPEKWDPQSREKLVNRNRTKNDRHDEADRQELQVMHL